MRPHEKASIKQALYRYAWPGGYPVFLVTTDGAALCPNCVKSEIRLIVDACRRDDNTGGWQALGADINWEDPNLYCDHCNERIESAYAEEEDSE